MMNNRVKRQQNTAQIGRFVVIISFVVFALQMLFPGCVLDPEESNDRLYEFWTIDGRSIDYYKNNLPEDMDYPTHILLENYIPGQKLRGKIKMIRQGWLPSDTTHAGISGIIFNFEKRYGPYGLIRAIGVEILTVSNDRLEGDLHFVSYGMGTPFIALKNFGFKEVT